MARDHKQAGDLGQFGDEVVGQTLGEVIVFRVAADIDEGQHSDRRPVR